MQYLSLKAHSKVYQFVLEDIYYIKTTSQHKVEVVTLGYSYAFSANLTEIEAEMPQLFRCHRNCLVNPNQIRIVDKKARLIHFRRSEIPPIVCDRAKLKALLTLL